MKTPAKIILALVAIVLLLGLAYQAKRAGDISNGVPKLSKESVLGCYVATLDRDVYSLNIVSEEDNRIFGTLVFDNYQKDSSSGLFLGEYENGILFGEYAFHSEGMDSLMQVIFRKTERGFQRGFGPVDSETGTQFVNLNEITYDNAYEFVRTDGACAEPL